MCCGVACGGVACGGGAELGGAASHNLRCTKIAKTITKLALTYSMSMNRANSCDLYYSAHSTIMVKLY